MLTRIMGLSLATALALVLLYLSAWWPFEWWGRDGLFGIEILRPQGDLVEHWLRGTALARFDELIWLGGGMLLLSLVQAIWSRVTRADT